MRDQTAYRDTLMNVSNEHQVAEEAIARALRATRANDAETAPKRHPRQTAQCPNIARFAAVLRRAPHGAPQATWTEDEARHVRGCPFCQSLFPLFKTAADEVARVSAQEDTVTSLNTSEETQTGLGASAAKRPGKSPKAPQPDSGE